MAYTSTILLIALIAIYQLQQSLSAAPIAVPSFLPSKSKSSLDVLLIDAKNELVSRYNGFSKNYKKQKYTKEQILKRYILPALKRLPKAIVSTSTKSLGAFAQTAGFMIPVGLILNSKEFSKGIRPFLSKVTQLAIEWGTVSAAYAVCD